MSFLPLSSLRFIGSLEDQLSRLRANVEEDEEALADPDQHHHHDADERKPAARVSVADKRPADRVPLFSDQVKQLECGIVPCAAGNLTASLHYCIAAMHGLLTCSNSAQAVKQSTAARRVASWRGTSITLYCVLG